MSWKPAKGDLIMYRARGRTHAFIVVQRKYYMNSADNWIVFSRTNRTMTVSDQELSLYFHTRDTELIHADGSASTKETPINST